MGRSKRTYEVAAAKRNLVSARKTLERLALIVSRVSLRHDKSTTVFLVSRRNNHSLSSCLGNACFAGANPAATRFYSWSRETMKFLRPVCTRFLLPSTSCKKPSRGRGAISICACSKLLCNRRTTKQRELPACDIGTRGEEFLHCGQSELALARRHRLRAKFSITALVQVP